MTAAFSHGLWFRHCVLLLGLPVLLAASASGGLGAPRYTITDLGTVGGSSYSYAASLNDNGQVVGFSYNAGGPKVHAFLYDAGGMIDLGTLGGDASYAYGINNNGQIVGYSYTAGSGQNFHAFLYSNGRMTDLGTLGGAWSTAYAINNQGQIIGFSPASTGSYHAFLYSNGHMTDLGTLGGTWSEAYGLNDKGEVVGRSFSRAFLYSAGHMIDLGTLSGWTSWAWAINDNGQVVGEYQVNGYSKTNHAFLYTGERMVDLGTLSGHSSSQALDINNAGQVVGYAYLNSSGVAHAFLYQGETMMDLNSLTVTNPGWVLQQANGINDHGQIAGWGVNPSGQTHAFLLTPLAPPNRPPVAACRNVLVATDANCTADASINDGSFDPDADPITLAQSPSGPYLLGTNLVTLTVTDSHGASNSCSALVIVQDTAPPQITCPSNLTVDCTSPRGAVVTFAPMATDNCSVPDVASVPASGSSFPIGTTPVQCTATDSAGNSDSCSFQLTVLSPRQMLERLLNQVNSSAARPQPLSATLNAALAALDRGDTTAVLNQLRAFQNKLRAQIASSEPALAGRLTAAAQDLINVLRSGA